MAITWKTLSQTVLTASSVAVYAVPVNTQTAVHTAQLWNSTASPVVVDVFVSGAVGAGADATHIDRVLVPGLSSGTVFGLINHKLSSLQQIYALGAGVTLTVSGAESV